MKKLSIIVALFAALVAGGATYATEVSPTEIDGATSVDTTMAKQLFDSGIVFVDVRKDSDWETGRVPGAAHLELKKVLEETTLLDVVQKDQEVVFYCNGPKCLRSSKASVKAVAWGFTKVYYYRDGFPAWEGAGNPVE